MTFGMQKYCMIIIIVVNQDECQIFHYENLPMQYTEIFFEEKKYENFIGEKKYYLEFSLKTYIVGTCLNRLAEGIHFTEMFS